jgi:hypothetical protein
MGTATPTRNPVTYAEGVLGVHNVYVELQETDICVEQARKAHADAVNALRIHRYQMSEHEGSLVEKVRIELVDSEQQISEAAFGRLVKERTFADDEHTRMRKDLVELECEVTAKETIFEDARSRQRTLRLRMAELSDLMRFYAAGKDAVTVAKLLINDPGRNWP